MQCYQDSKQVQRKIFAIINICFCQCCSYAIAILAMIMFLFLPILSNFSQLSNFIADLKQYSVNFFCIFKKREILYDHHVTNHFCYGAF